MAVMVRHPELMMKGWATTFVLKRSYQVYGARRGGFGGGWLPRGMARAHGQGAGRLAVGGKSVSHAVACNEPDMDGPAANHGGDSGAENRPTANLWKPPSLPLAPWVSARLPDRGMRPT